MKKLYPILIIGLLLCGCKEKTQNKNTFQNTTEFNQDLANELKKMVAIDQVAASNAFPPEAYSNLSQEKWELFKDSIFRTNQKRAKEILDLYGFVGYDLAGKEGSNNFWLIVQHSGHNPDFQNEVLEKMKLEVENSNAKSSSYGFLLDRVKLNTGQAQVYGTQVRYDVNSGQAYPKKLEDSLNVNKRRKSIGLEPLEIYLNERSEMHFEMNKEVYFNKGIMQPKLYKLE